MNKIYVTQPSLPDLDEFLPYLENIWENKWLTNNGPYHQQLEKELAEYLGVKHISLFSNGTLALMIAMRVLKIEGEVITTPYSFVATAHSLLWNNIKPVFCDIQRSDCNIDTNKIEELITENTQAILPVHVYGNPCDTERLQSIAKKHDLKLIYDAAHAFGVSENGDSVLNCGDLSIISFHATKIFNTFEGGAIICHDIETKNKIDKLKNFSFEDEVTVSGVGINGKMNEVQAAFGVLQLKHIDENISMSKQISDYYDSKISEISGLNVMPHKNGVVKNYSYYPIFVMDDYKITRDELYEKFKSRGIFPRRYFYPLITKFAPYNELDLVADVNTAKDIANRVLCLPIYAGLTKEEQEKIIDILNE